MGSVPDLGPLDAVIASSPAVPTRQVVHVFTLDAPDVLGPDDLAMVRDSTETTVVTASRSRLERARRGGRAIEGPFAVIRLEISLSFQAPGFVAAATTACAAGGINVVVLSTYSYDYLLVPEPDLAAAVARLAARGFPTPPADPEAGPVVDLAPAALAEAFSRHRFAETYPQLADDIRWVLVGGPTLAGRQAVVDACEDSARQLATTTNRFTAFRTVGAGDTVLVDSTGEYISADGHRSVVASCDLYDFRDGQLVTITSYTVLVGPDEDVAGPDPD